MCRNFFTSFSEKNVCSLREKREEEKSRFHFIKKHQTTEYKNTSPYNKRKKDKQEHACSNIHMHDGRDHRPCKVRRERLLHVR